MNLDQDTQILHLTVGLYRACLKYGVCLKISERNWLGPACVETSAGRSAGGGDDFIFFENQPKATIRPRPKRAPPLTNSVFETPQRALSQKRL